MIVSAVVPPWQNPDEPTHVFLAQLLALPAAVVNTSPVVQLPNGDLLTRVEQDIQGQILESMAAHRWWEAYGSPPPEVIPRAFVLLGQFSSGTYAPPIYYGIAAGVLRLTAPDDIDGTYWRLRGLSIVLAVIALWCVWAGTRLFFGDSVALGATAIASLHPQALITTMAVNPDVLTAVWGAFIWWQVAELVNGRRRGLAFLLLIVGAVAAVLTKRSAVPAAAMALLVAVWVFLPGTWRFSPRQRVLGALAALAGVAAVAAATLVSDGLFTAVASFWSSVAVQRRPLTSGLLPVAAEYVGISIDYAWLIAGWQRFSPPEWWLWIARGLTAAGLAGAVVAVIRARGRAQDGLAVAWSFFLIQAVAILVPGFWNLAAPQGRYLAPVLAPLAVLLWMGIMGLMPVRWHAAAGPLLVGAIAVIDATALTATLVPAYMPSMLYVP